MTLHDQQRETALDEGRRPRIKVGAGTGRRPVLTLADRLLACVLHYRLGLPQVAIAALFGVRPETVNKRIRDVRQLLEQAGHTIQTAPNRLTKLDDLHELARSSGANKPGHDQTSVLLPCNPLVLANNRSCSPGVQEVLRPQSDRRLPGRRVARSHKRGAGRRWPFRLSAASG
jgi:hypothetical protein